MKEEINIILGFIDCPGEACRIRDAIRLLDSSASDGLQRIIEQLKDAVASSDLRDHDQVGLYNFFLGCLEYERDEYNASIEYLQYALPEIWGSPLNKALICWCIGLCHSELGDFPRARRGLQRALQFLESRAHINSSRSDQDEHRRDEIRLQITDTLEHWSNEPLFRIGQFNHAKKENAFPLQDPPIDEGEGTSISLNIPITVSNTNSPVNNVSIQMPVDRRPEGKTHFEEPIPTNQTRTDIEGYMVLYDQPIYGNVRAGKPGEFWEFEISAEHPEIDVVFFEGKAYSLHSLRASAQIAPTKDHEWGWMKVKGHSMNKMKGHISIEDGDYVFVKRHPVPRENDLVVALLADKTTGEYFAVVKRFKGGNKLVSETMENGLEYEAINMDENTRIHGIVYAVAKPIHS